MFQLADLRHTFFNLRVNLPVVLDSFDDFLLIFVHILKRLINFFDDAICSRKSFLENWRCFVAGEC